MRPWALAVCLAAGVAVSCGDSDSSESPGQGSLVGTERLGWDQPAADAAEVGTFRFLVYVDDVRQVLTGVSCASSVGPAGFACTSALPIMSPGTHTLEIASYRQDSPGLESPRSLPLLVTLSGGVSAPGGVSGPDPAAVDPVDTLPATQTVRTHAGLVLRADAVARSVEGATALAFDPDGVLFIGDRFGRVRRLAPGGRLDDAIVITDAVTTASGGGVLALALDTAFARTRFVYVIDTVASRAGLEFRLSRYREVGGRLGERAVLLTGVAASAEPAASLAVEADGRLLAAFDAGDGAGGYSGALLRLNADGTTPAGQRAASPVLAAPFMTPRGLVAAADGESWWLADGGRQRLEQISIHRRTGVARLPLEVAGVDRPQAVLEVGPDAVRGLDRAVLLVGSSGDTPLVLASPGQGPVLASEPLALTGVDQVRALTFGPDGAVYLATARAVVRLAVP